MTKGNLSTNTRKKLSINDSLQALLEQQMAHSQSGDGETAAVFQLAYEMVSRARWVPTSQVQVSIKALVDEYSEAGLECAEQGDIPSAMACTLACRALMTAAKAA